MTTIETEKQYLALDEASQMLKAVAHPVRLSIMSVLQGDRLTVTEIFERLGVEQAVASHHLSIMKDRGVLIAEREGKNVYYALRHPRMLQIVDCIYDCCESKKVNA